MRIDKNQVRQALELLRAKESDPFEVRVLLGNKTLSGYFTSPELVAEELEAARWNENIAQVYTTLQVVNEDCYSRQQRDKFVERPKQTTTDNDILGFNWLFIDLDPKRPSGISSSDSELEKAKQKANEIYSYLKNQGFPLPLVALSGNGVHLLYRISLENSPENVELVKSCLKALSLLFSDDDVDVDTANFNPSRICKLYGTTAAKGANTPDRPHRMSRLTKVPEKIEITPKAYLKKLSSAIPKEPESIPALNGYRTNGKGFDLAEWMHAHAIGVKQVTDISGGGKKYVLEHCPFDESHKGKDAAIFQMANGAIGFKCFHNSCSEKTWRDVRLLFEPDAYDGDGYVQNAAKPNFQNPDYKPVAIAVTDKSGKPEPAFYTTLDILKKPVPEREYIRTGITGIDTRIGGLEKGLVSALSGLRAAGKSSVLSQIAVNAAQQGYRTALFSGELTERRVLDWLTLQAAGKNHTHKTQYENLYYADDEVQEPIAKWLNEKIWVYNNNYGNDAIQLLELLDECTAKHQVDLVIVDNLMALSLAALPGRGLYEQQSQLMCTLSRFAQCNNVHVVLVAHPRKEPSFLRMDSISGSGDISNRVDNCFIIHRNNLDFQKNVAEFFKGKAPFDPEKGDNVIEICKNRESGVQDVFIPLWFEKETKRLRNDAAEYTHYAWEYQSDEFWTEDLLL